MTTSARAIFRLLPVVALVVTLSACTTKGTIKATTDPTTDILSSTTGRSWFTEEGLVKQDHRVQAFATFNFENLKDDMARGQGEYLSSLGMLLGVVEEQQAEFFSLTREQYPVLVDSDRTTPEEMLAALNRELVLRPALRRS